MSVRHLCAVVLLLAGVGVLALSAVALLVLPRPYARLHALSPAASLGTPLVVLAAAAETGPGRAALKLLFIALLSAAGGAVTTMALARAQLRADGAARRTGAVGRSPDHTPPPVRPPDSPSPSPPGGEGAAPGT